MQPPSQFTDDWLKKQQNPFLNLQPQSGNPFLNPQPQWNNPFVTMQNPFTTTTTTQQSNQSTPSNNFVTPQNILFLQSTVGNQRVGEMLEGQQQFSQNSEPEFQENNDNGSDQDDYEDENYDDPDPNGFVMTNIEEDEEPITTTKTTKSGSLKGDDMTIKQQIDKKREYVGHKSKIMSVKSVGKRITSPKKHKKVKKSSKQGQELTDNLTFWAAKHHQDTLHQIDWSAQPWLTGNLLNGRFPKGPLLSRAEMKVIVEFSKSNEGRLWLSSAGIFPITDAVLYLTEHKYQTWLKLEASNRLLMASLAWKYRDKYAIPLETVVDTPPYRLGRSMEIKSLSDKKKSEKTRKTQLRQELDHDIRMEWLKTFVDVEDGTEVGLGKRQKPLSVGVQQAIEGGALSKSTTPTENPEKAMRRHTMANEILKKVLLLLHSGMQLYSKKSWSLEDYNGPVARALSHGGRVNIRIPSLQHSTENAYALTDWLGITKKGGKLSKKGPVGKRSFGTHHVEIGENVSKDGDVIPGTGSFRETGSTTASGKNIGNTQLFGVDLSVGGIGKLDFNGDVILPDGAHGHLFIGYRPPTLERDGALQLGIETTAPGAPSTVGYHHGPESSEATANPESSFGGLKQDKIGDQITPKAKIGKSSNEISHKETETIYDTSTYKSHTVKVEGQEKVKEFVPDEATMGRYVDLYGKHGRNWLGHLMKLEDSFNLLYKKTGAVRAYEDLIGNGEMIKEIAGRENETDLEV